MISQAKCICGHQFQNKHPDFQSYDLNDQCFTYICAEWGEVEMDENCLQLQFNYDSVGW